MSRLSLHFPHGLGDSSYFAHLLVLYVRRGFEVTVACTPDKAILYRDSGVKTADESSGFPVIGWAEGGEVNDYSRANLLLVNKPALNINLPPLPDIGRPEELWSELCGVRLDLRRYIPREDWTAVRSYLATLPRPVVLLHTIGNTSQETKSISEPLTKELYCRLLDVMPGTILLLDWDNRVPRLASYRVRHLTDDWEWLPLPRFLALLYEADLLVGVDSGPLHAARFADLPTVGLWPTARHYPPRWTLPRARQVNVVPHELVHQWNKRTRIGFNIVESLGGDLNSAFVADTCARMLAAPRYLDADHQGADVQLQQFVLDWEHGPGCSLSDVVDRHHSYDYLFREVRARFRQPLFVETGCIRAEEDWRGAGFSTYLFGAFLERYGGELHSVDNDAGHCEFARQATREMSCVQVHHGDSVEFLAQFNRPIDILLLDSWDAYIPGFAEHALKEAQAAQPWLHARSILIFDDTAYLARHFHGKGELAVPWLLDHGWRIVYSGYQTLLERATP